MESCKSLLRFSNPSFRETRLPQPLCKWLEDSAWKDFYQTLRKSSNESNRYKKWRKFGENKIWRKLPIIKHGFGLNTESSSDCASLSPVSRFWGSSWGWGGCGDGGASDRLFLQGKTYATWTLPGKGTAQTRVNKLRQKKACLKNILKAVKMLSLVSSVYGSRKSGKKVLFTPMGPDRFTCVDGMILDGPSRIRHQHVTVCLYVVAVWLSSPR